MAIVPKRKHGKNHGVVDVESLGREHTLSTSKSYGDDYVAKLIRIHELRKLATEIVRNEGEPIVERDMCPECSNIQSSFEYFETGFVEDTGETVDGYDDDDWIAEVVENGEPWYYAFSLDDRNFLVNGDDDESLEIDS